MIHETLEQMASLEKLNLIPTKVHLNKSEFEAIVDEIYPTESPLRDMLDVLPGLLFKVLDEERRYAEDRRRMLASWGKDGTTFWGLPVVCEDVLSHWWIEAEPAPYRPKAIRMLEDA